MSGFLSKISIIPFLKTLFSSGKSESLGDYLPNDSLNENGFDAAPIVKSLEKKASNYLFSLAEQNMKQWIEPLNSKTTRAPTQRSGEAAQKKQSMRLSAGQQAVLLSRILRRANRNL